MFMTVSGPSTSASQSSQSHKTRMTESAEAQPPHPWIWYFWLGKVTFRTSVSLISCYIRQGGPAEQKDPGHPPETGGVSDTAQEALSQRYFRMPLTKSQRTSAHGLSLLWWCCWDWDSIPFLLPPQLGMPPHRREDFKVYQTWLQSSDSRYPAQDGARLPETMESSLLM